MKWRTVEGVLVLKLTDDTTVSISLFLLQAGLILLTPFISTLVEPAQCLKYRTSSSVYLNRFEVLNHLLMEKMQNRRVPPPQPLRAPAAEALAAATPRSGSPAPAAAATKTGETAGAGKKKGKKGKK